MGDADAPEREGSAAGLYSRRCERCPSDAGSSAGPMIAVCNSTPLIALAMTKFTTREIRNLFN
jgi:hypothetical protein